MRRTALLALALALAAVGHFAGAASVASAQHEADLPTVTAPPRLVVFLVVDQLRGDMPLRMEHRFQGGLRYLMQRGAYFTQAHFQHATTFTATGHATLFTGGNSAQHGMAGNDWYDPERRQVVYCVEDDRHTLLGQPTKPHEGTSPRHLTCSTIGDELILADGRSRVFAVSLKDRGAILPGGHLGKAFWYSSSSGSFGTSTFYYDELPAWVQDWNALRKADQYRGQSWMLLNERPSYRAAARDDRPQEQDFKQMGRVFPHPLPDEPADFYSALRYTPMGDALTLDFARHVIQHEQLGQDEVTDLLAVGLSATDYIGHTFGPESLEAEDNLLRLDRSLGRFLEFLEETVGLRQSLIVLSSDHGVDEIPEYLQSVGIPAGRHDPARFVAQLNAALKTRFDCQDELVSGFYNPSLYLDRDALERLKLDVSVVERATAEEVLKLPGFAYAVTRTDLLAGSIAPDPILRKVQRSFHPRRSGNVLIVQSPSWYLYSSATAFAAMHGSPYPYDTWVPVVLAGWRIPAQRIDQPVAPEDLANTITSLLKIKPPSGSTGTALPLKSKE